jgi:hypothetical protein
MTEALARQTEAENERAIAEAGAQLKARTRFGITVLALFFVALSAELLARRIVAVPADEQPVQHRAENVVAVSKNPANLPKRPVGKTSLFLAGNSHTYTLPGLKRGDPLRSDPGVTLIDDLAKEVSEAHPPRANATYYRVSNPNFLPFEMLTHFSYLFHHGYVPDVAIVGFTFRNIARDTALRHDVHRVYHEPAFAEEIGRALKSPDIEADPRIILQVEAEVRQAAFEDREDQMRSDADRLDQRLMEKIGAHVTLIGQSAELRARIYRSFAYGLDSLFEKRTQSASYDVIDADLDFNLACEKALVRMLRQKNVATIYYLTPERTDLPPLISPEREEKETIAFATWAKDQGVAVIDARHVVPNEYWGFEHETPDRSHFTEPGHLLLAKFIAHQPEVEAKLARLDSP